MIKEPVFVPSVKVMVSEPEPTAIESIVGAPGGVSLETTILVVELVDVA